MAQTVDFTKDRAVRTISAAKRVAHTWVWDERSIAEIEASLAAIVGDSGAAPPVTGQEEVASRAEQAMLVARSAWDAGLEQLHRWTIQGLGMAKNKFRNDSAKYAQLHNLSSRAASRKAILAEALAWESAWSSVAPTWAPVSTNTLTAFKALRKQCNEDLQAAYSDASADWREQAEKLTGMARALEDINQGWYADATRVFPVGTPDGEMIRSTVPTTYVPPPPKEDEEEAAEAPPRED